MTIPADAPIEKNGAPGEIRTPNPQIRSLVLCPIELRARSDQPSALRRPQDERPKLEFLACQHPFRGEHVEP
jgi:hypothetical protein